MNRVRLRHSFLLLPRHSCGREARTNVIFHSNTPEEATMSEHSVVRLPLWSICLALTLGLGIVVGSFLGKDEVLASTVTGTQPAAGISAAQNGETKPALQTTFAPVVQKVMPSVVNIFSS